MLPYINLDISFSLLGTFIIAFLLITSPPIFLLTVTEADLKALSQQMRTKIHKTK